MNLFLCLNFIHYASIYIKLKIVLTLSRITYIYEFSAHELKVLLKSNTISPSSVAGASKIMGLFAGFAGIRSSVKPKKI